MSLCVHVCVHLLDEGAETRVFELESVDDIDDVASEILDVAPQILHAAFYLYVCMYVCMHVCMYVCMCVAPQVLHAAFYVYVCMYV